MAAGEAVTARERETPVSLCLGMWHVLVECGEHVGRTQRQDKTLDSRAVVVMTMLLLQKQEVGMFRLGSFASLCTVKAPESRTKATPVSNKELS